MEGQAAAYFANQFSESQAGTCLLAKYMFSQPHECEEQEVNLGVFGSPFKWSECSDGKCWCVLYYICNFKQLLCVEFYIQ